MIAILLLAAVIASTYTLGKAALEISPPIFLVGVRLLIAGLCFLIYYRITHKKFPRLIKKELWMMLSIIFFGFYSGFILEFWALQYMTSAKTALLYSLSPIVAAFFSYFIFHEKMTIKKAVGLGIGLIGFLPVLMNSQTAAEKASHAFLFFSWPEVALFVAVICFAYGWIVMRKALKTYNLSASFVSGFGMTVGGFACLATSYLVEVPAHSASWIHTWLPITQLQPFLLLTAGLIIGGNIIGYILYTYCLRHYTATVMMFGELLTPLFAALYGWLFLHETVSIYFFISMTILILGLYIFFQEEKRLGYMK